MAGITVKRVDLQAKAAYDIYRRRPDRNLPVSACGNPICDSIYNQAPDKDCRRKR